MNNQKKRRVNDCLFATVECMYNTKCAQKKKAYEMNEAHVPLLNVYNWVHFSHWQIKWKWPNDRPIAQWKKSESCSPQNLINENKSNQIGLSSGLTTIHLLFCWIQLGPFSIRIWITFHAHCSYGVGRLVLGVVGLC